MRPAAVLLALLLAACHAPKPEPLAPPSPWPTVFHDNQRTNATTLPAPLHPVLKWRTQIAQSHATTRPISMPLVAAGNVVYVVGDKTELYKVHPDGSIEWSVRVPKMTQRSADSIDCSGGVLIGGAKLVRVNTAGKVRHVAGLDLHLGGLLQAEQRFYCPLTLPDGDIISYSVRDVSGQLANVYASEAERLTLDHQQRWVYRSFGFSTAPLVWLDDRTYLTDDSDCLVLLDPKGAVTAKLQDVSYRNTPVLFKGKVIVVSKDRHSIHWLDATTLSLLSRASVAPDVARARACGPDGTLYISSQPQATPPTKAATMAGKLLAFDAAGKLKWSRSVPHISAQLALAGDTLLALFSGNDLLAAYRSSDGKQLWSISIPGCIGYPAIGEDRTIYVVDRQGGLNTIGEAASAAAVTSASP